MTDVNVWSSALSDDQMIKFTSKCESQVGKLIGKLCDLFPYTFSYNKNILMSPLWEQVLLITLPNHNNNQRLY